MIYYEGELNFEMLILYNEVHKLVIKKKFNSTPERQIFHS